MKTFMVTHFGGFQGSPPGSQKEVKIYIKMAARPQNAVPENGQTKTTLKKPPSGAARAPPEGPKRAETVLPGRLMVRRKQGPAADAPRSLKKLLPACFFCDVFSMF